MLTDESILTAATTAAATTAAAVAVATAAAGAFWFSAHYRYPFTATGFVFCFFEEFLEFV